MSLRIGIIGAGAIGQIHAATFKQLDNAVVAGMADAHLPLAQRLPPSSASNASSIPQIR